MSDKRSPEEAKKVVQDPAGPRRCEDCDFSRKSTGRACIRHIKIALKKLPSRIHGPSVVPLIYYEIVRVLDDPAASYWLKDAIRILCTRDPVDAANDAEVLSDLMARRVDMFT